MAINWKDLAGHIGALITAGMILGAACLVLGCQSTQRAVNETDMVQLKEVVAMMDDLGLAGYAELDFGDGKVYATQEFGINLGTVRVRVMSRPHADRSPP